MTSSKKDLLNSALLFIISLLLVSDLFINKGRSATFDGPTHLANIALFYKSIAQGIWHVTWTDGFANYGMPLGILAQQFTSYIGAFINLFSHNVVFSYNATYFIGAFFSTYFFYRFLRLYFKPENALIGAFLFNFAPYRIINIYIRGALPEFFGSVPLPLILIGMYYLFHNERRKGFTLVTLSMAALVLIHPMMVVISSFIFIPYLLYLLNKKKEWRSVLIACFSLLLGIGLAGYYIIPLTLEIKYFYYGLGSNHFIPNQFMTFENFINPHWYYFYKDDIFTRGHFIKLGLLEAIVLLIGGVALVSQTVKNKKVSINILTLSLGISIVTIFLMLKEAAIFYRIDLLSSIQRQWRMFSALIFIPPIIISYLLEKYGKFFLILPLIILICFIRFPELYGKNYALFAENSYFFTKENLHANIMNTVWTGETRYYPVKQEKPEIVEGSGEIVSQEVKDTHRTYVVKAATDIRMADYTFYFPGWHVLVDNRETIIQFQDPQYRGVITYLVPKGDHKIDVIFKDTKVRFIGKVISLLSLLLLFLGIKKYVR